MWHVDSEIKVMSGYKHSVKVPTQYKRTAAALKEALEQKKSLRNFIYEEKHARIPSLQKTLKLYSDNRGAVDDAIEKTQILIENPRLTPSLCKVLVTELLFGSRRSINGESKPVQTVKSYKDRLEEAISSHVNTANTLKNNEESHKRVRYVRVNTNLISMEEVYKYLKIKGFEKKEYEVFENYSEFLSAVEDLGEKEYMLDMHLDDLLIFHAKSKQYWATCNEYVMEKKLLLQDKAPSLAVEILQPTPGSIVLDMCAAPGMKTILACNRMQNKGKIFAVELNPQRFDVLSRLTKEAGCKIVETIKSDVLKIDSTKCPNVEYILVDPSCSGIGMQRLSFENEEKDPARLRKLSYLQFRMLSHAMTAFPDVKRIVYSTCSLYEEENEQVIQKCLEMNPNFKLLSGKKALRNKWTNVGNPKYKNIGKNCIYARPTDLTDGMFIALFERSNNTMD